MTLVCTGEGATSEGEFWECMNTACLEKLPLLVLVEDNGFAISVPVEAQTAGGSISAARAFFPDLFVARMRRDGFPRIFPGDVGCRGLLPRRDVVRRWCMRDARVRTRIRLSDDERLYKTAAERASEAARDPLVTISRSG